MSDRYGREILRPYNIKVSLNTSRGQLLFAVHLLMRLEPDARVSWRG